jgi:hypothetical protein
MGSSYNAGRLAGWLYLFMTITGAFSVLYVPSKLIVPGNAAVTAGNIVRSETLFRYSIVSELVAAVIFIFLVQTLYRLFHGVNRTHASLMVILALVSVSIAFVIVLSEFAALDLFRGAEFLSVLDKPERDAIGMLFLDLHRYGFVINGIFWGLWLFPFGLLVIRSGFVPRILGVLLIIACFGYLTWSLTELLLPGYASVVGRIMNIPEAVGELSIMFWLLLKGADVKQ